MAIYTDQLNRQLHISAGPRRIISLVPSQTELLYDLGLRNEVVGITKFCRHPEEWFRNKTRVGGTKTYDFEKIEALAPDLIIGNKEENEQVQMERLMNQYPVWMSDIFTLADALDMIARLGTLLDRTMKAEKLISQIQNAFSAFDSFVKKASLQPKKVAYFIWRKPYMVAAEHTFIHHLLMRCGFQNAFQPGSFSRYPEISLQQLKDADPELILLSSEPYPFKEKHIAEFQEICPNARIMTVDGELFSWYGSRLLKAPAYFSNLITALQHQI
ncbi:MAG TPA: helical backbone metal receptor [Chitinophagales bacterium]|nr:helical backbone metal receptor [Chitinophagales bacterium]